MYSSASSNCSCNFVIYSTLLSSTFKINLFFSISIQLLHFSHLIHGIYNVVKVLSFAIFISVSASISNQGSGLFSSEVLCVLHISNIYNKLSPSIYATSAIFIPLYSNLYSI